MQLKEASRGKGSVKIEEVFNNQEIDCLEKLNDDLEGQTEKQRNPHSKGNLAWAAWVIVKYREADPLNIVLCDPLNIAS